MPDSSLSGGDMALVAIVLVISLAALGFAAYLVKAVLAADQGTVKMREIAQAVQEGAAAYLRRQFRTLGVFAVIVFLLLLVLPVADGGWGTRIGRAVFFLIGAAFAAWNPCAPDALSADPGARAPPGGRRTLGGNTCPTVRCPAGT